MSDSGRNVPLFALNAVLFPGSVTPLHIFEERYRTLVRDLLAIPDPAERVFGVVAIREGYEVGDHTMASMHRIGTLVQLTEAAPHPDGRFDIEVTGRSRILVHRVDPSGPYLTAETEICADPDAALAIEGAARAQAAFDRYRRRLSQLRGGPVLVGSFPADPELLSYALAGSSLLTLSQRQTLLEAEDAATRLGLLERLLNEEMRAMRAIASLPATELARTRWSPN